MRPDQPRFDLFERHFVPFDDRFQRFADEHGLILRKNMNRQPGREFQRGPNPLWMMGINLSEHWLKGDYTDDLLHDVGIVLNYTDQAEQKRYQKRAFVRERVPFSQIVPDIDALLFEGYSRLQNWSEEVTREGGPAQPDEWVIFTGIAPRNVLPIDQARFDLFERHFAALDEPFQRFADSHALTVVKNAYQQPGREMQREQNSLEKPGPNPFVRLAVRLSEHWQQGEYTDDLPHDFGIAVIANDNAGTTIYSRRKLLRKAVPISQIVSEIEALLQEGYALVQDWVTEVSRGEGPTKPEEWEIVREG